MKKIFLIVCFTIVSVDASRAMDPIVNVSHLDHLIETIVMDGDSVAVVHIYANYPTYAWVDAKESGPEGIACVDDAARAAVVLLRHYELSNDAESLRKARLLLRFVMKMQADDGQFYNFIFADHSINRTGTTSFKSFGWWASRAVWSLSSAYRLLKTSDPAFAERCRRSVERTFPSIDSVLARYGKSTKKDGYRLPEWLLYKSGADVSSELVLGLVEYARANNSARVRTYIRKFSKGLVLMQDGDVSTYPYGVHRSWETQWHAWGNGQTQALASSGPLLKRPAFVRSAEREAEGFFTRLLIHGWMKEMDVATPGKTIAYEQIAYGVRPMAVGLLRLYDATKNERYLKMAGLSASWLFGNNTLRQTMYDTATGRCFDGITNASTLNRNSGAESTIEALYTITELERYPAARQYLSYVRTDAFTRGTREAGVFTDEKGNAVVLVIDTAKKAVTLLEGDAAARFIGSK